MSAGLVASLVLKLNDQGSGAATRALQTVTRSLKDMEGAAKSASGNAISAFQKFATAREILGIRSEKAVQNEIRQTEAAYQRLAQSGQASQRELGRAQDAMREKVRELRRELDGVNKSAGGAGSALTRAMSVVGGLAAAKAVVAGPIRQTMSYDRQLAQLSNTAFAGQSMEARRTGMRTLDAAINSAVRVGGGTREGALGTLDKLVASGAFSDVGEATRLLPILTKAGTAANADPSHLADIAIRAKQTFGLADTGLALDQAMKAGQLGGFELKDMAKWLPQQMAMARNSGLRGESGFRALLAANQGAAITTGTKDQAGNALFNLLGKINSQDTAKDAQKLGIDLPGTLAAARGKGINSLDAFVNLTEQIVSRDKKYVALREKSKSTTGDEQRATFESMGDILQGSAIGKIVQDREAMMGLLGIMNNRAYVRDIYDKTGNAQGTANDAFGLIAETPSFKAEQLAAERAISMQRSLDRINPLLGDLAGGLVEVMREWPAFAASIEGATLALTALAGAAATMALGVALFGGKGALVAAGGAAAGAAGGLLAGAGRVAAGALLGGGAFAATVAGAGGYAVGSAVNGGINAADERFGSSIGTDIGRLVAFVMAGLGNKDAERALNIEVQIDGETVATAVNKRNARQASRS